MTLVIIIGIAALLFGLAFMTKRRFGVLGLALAAGSILAQTLGSWLTDLAREYQLPVEPLSYTTAALVFLTLAPSLLLMLSGPKYRGRGIALLGAASYAVIGTLLVLGPLTADLPTLESGVRDTLNIVASYQNWIVAGGILVAILDIMLVHSSSPKHSDKKSKH